MFLTFLFILASFAKFHELVLVQLVDIFSFQIMIYQPTVYNLTNEFSDICQIFASFFSQTSCSQKMNLLLFLTCF